MNRVGQRGRWVAAALLATTLLVATPVFSGDLDGDCRVGDVPAATLLIPFFEVDLDAPNGITTLFSVANTRTGFAALARVTLWTDWGVATGAFDLLLLPGDVQTMNVRDLLNTGSAPTTSGQGLFHFPDCIEPVGGMFENPIVLRRAHTGVEITGGLCASAPRADTTMATGYITVDLVTRCSDPTVLTTPATPGYLSGPNRLVSDDNVLWGDFFLVDPGDNLAQGQTAVPVVADPDRFGPGDLTFYGRLVSFTGADARAPLSSSWRARFATSGVFDDTELLVWRDTGSPGSSLSPCGVDPPWYPLTERRVKAWSEVSTSSTWTGGPRFPLAAQRVSVADFLEPPFAFGYMDLWLDLETGTPNQAWVLWLMRAQGRFSVGQNGIRVNDLCPPP